MSHQAENPLIIDVVGEVEPPESDAHRASKKSGRSTGKKGFFRKEKSGAETTATRAATEADVDAAKRAAVAASVPPVQGPASQSTAAQSAPSQPDPAAEQEASASAQQPEPSTASQPQPEEDAQPVQEAQPQVQEAAQPVVQQAQQAPAAAQSQRPVQAEAPQPYVPAQPAPVQPAVEPQVQPQPRSQQPAAAQQPAPSVQPAPAQQPAPPVQPQAQQPVPAAQPHVQQPVAPSAVPVAVAPQVLPGNMAASVPTRSRAFYVFGILAVAVLLFAAAAFGFFSFLQNEDRLTLVPTSTVSDDSGEVKPIVSASLDQASKVSLRATAEGWNEQESTPAVAYIKRVEGDSDGESFERYFAFAPDQSASVSLPSGRYAFSFIPPMNSDGSVYAMPEMVDMVVGDGGMAVLPVDFSRVAKEDVTQEQVIRTLAQLKTAYEKGDASLHTEAFSRTIDLALNTWFPLDGAQTEKPATELTNEQQQALNAQADSQQGSGSTGTDSSAGEHEHAWVAQHESRWQPSVVPVIDAAAWESPVYARYRCQEGILFETLEECQAHVRERGNEPYSASNEIIRIDYHPAVVHYEQQGSYADVITGYRCSICGVRGTLQ